MKGLEKLVHGYKAFIEEEFRHQERRYKTLAEKGQSPKTMVISCCDSRVSPSRIFTAGAGELFTLRNVANLVPPFELDGTYHGTSAAIEFAVLGLDIRQIVVLGHTRCGGIRACLETAVAPGNSVFIAKWLSILSPVRDRVIAENPDIPVMDLAPELEKAAIAHSIGNLEAFPFIRERVAENRLELMGACFDIATGQLHALDRVSGSFLPIE